MMSWPDGYGKRILEEVDSTLDEAARIATGLAGPEWILALKQTKGRGRRGRDWKDPKGNFAATLVMRPDDPPARAALRSFVAALALYDAVEAVTGRSDGLALKWPNDVLLNGGKLAGILLESNGRAGDLSHLFVGIGVNLVETPMKEWLEPNAVWPVSLHGETGVQVTPEIFLEALAEAYARYELQFTTYGFAPIRTAWLQRAARLGEVITAKTGVESHEGTFETVDEEGNLVLNTAKGRITVAAADIFF
ncbi:BirA family transcriptional regulator, biotin operon repressor / biotin-[acetyl-CoA-carboxylase] ligase [Epibacterium ulvae]|uniref:biotin--[biotin carboxyl-carrier protein] ligase n=1 Tax=Epibacterium ulvae TaxID=1156985 RepID=A0A1G5QNX4_9RHOB|nr:biotin--[acetyl-CoA-carboxylase] ligase [Epibacterium ulvae]SCZ63523.1 BirA family transcriptional regulator, biotin operon repressor / biotin-[acetyl-CoA-carboxylase] ligase [Epibacterium ulvae]